MKKMVHKSADKQAPDTLQLELKGLPWGPYSAVFVTLGVYFGSQFLGSLIVVMLPVIFGADIKSVTNWFESSAFAQFISVVVIEVLALAILYWFLKRRKAKLAQLGLVAPQWRDVGYTLAGFGTYFLINFVAIIAVSALIPAIDTAQQQELGFNTSTTGIGLIFVFISLVVMPPIVEEIVMRGFLYTGLVSKLPKIIAALVTSVLFALAHLQFGLGNNLLWVAAIDTFILSMVLVYLRDKTGSLWSPIAVHFLKNLLAFLYLFVFKVV